ncbi:MAG: 4,5-DOPA dioxygenase extradiol [Steroidobacteraceae bacterium]
MNHTATSAPALFIGHGSPMNAIEDNRYTRAWRDLGQRLAVPRAILAVSAHWYTRGTAITAMANPRTIHDFGGFPQALFDVRYPAPGDIALAREVRDMLTPLPVALDEAWGLDHGTWSVLIHMYPQAQVPVLQLSIDATQPPLFHHELGKRLQALRDSGVMIFGNGNVVHNLRTIQWQPDAPAPQWAVTFNDYVKDAVRRGDHAALIDYRAAGESAELAVPSLEHYLPLLYVLGAAREDEAPEILIDGIELGTISMLSVGVGVNSGFLPRSPGED